MSHRPRSSHWVCQTSGGPASISGPCVTATPSMTHSAVAPDWVLRHSRSALPSPEISNTLAICQNSGTPLATIPERATVVPFISHAATSPDCVLRHTMSARPSPSRSPTPAICQERGTPTAITAFCLTEIDVFTGQGPQGVVVTSTSQTETSPDCVLRHRRSALPSPSRSRTPAICHDKGTPLASTKVAGPVPSGPPNFTAVPSINHTATSP